MWQVQAVARPRRLRAWLMAVALVPALRPRRSAPAAATRRRPSPRSSPTRARPFGDLLVPKLTASVTDGAVGVTVDQPVTVSAEDGVLGAVTMVNDDEGTPVAGELSPDGLTWAHHRAARLQQALHAERAVARPRRRDQPADDLRDAFAREPDDALRAAQRRRGRRRRPAGRGPLRREHPEPAGGRSGRSRSPPTRPSRARSTG